MIRCADKMLINNAVTLYTYFNMMNYNTFYTEINIKTTMSKYWPSYFMSLMALYGKQKVLKEKYPAHYHCTKQTFTKLINYAD